jgi:hypothetical protein
MQEVAKRQYVVYLCDQYSDQLGKRVVNGFSSTSDLKDRKTQDVTEGW